MARPLVRVVDHPVDNRARMTAVLERASMDVAAVEDARAMDRHLATGAVPVVFILDLSLPGEGGGSILHRPLRAPRSAGCPMLACTARAMVGDARRGLAAGFDAYLTKPVNVSTPAGVVAGFLARGDPDVRAEWGRRET